VAWCGVWVGRGVVWRVFRGWGVVACVLGVGVRGGQRRERVQATSGSNCVEQPNNPPPPPHTHTPHTQRTRDHAEQVHLWAAAQHHTEAQQHPGQVGRREVEYAQEREVDVRVAAAPHVHHHERQAAAQKLQVRKGRQQREQPAATQQHPEEVGALATERACAGALAVGWVGAQQQQGSNWAG
jgi:hypothetical protein